VEEVKARVKDAFALEFSFGLGLCLAVTFYGLVIGAIVLMVLQSRGG
jgi:uncharacterized membrane protein SpoIIM required for sporulation